MTTRYMSYEQAQKQCDIKHNILYNNINAFKKVLTGYTIDMNGRPMFFVDTRRLTMSECLKCLFSLGYYNPKTYYVNFKIINSTNKILAVEFIISRNISHSKMMYKYIISDMELQNLKLNLSEAALRILDELNHCLKSNKTKAQESTATEEQEMK